MDNNINVTDVPNSLYRVKKKELVRVSKIMAEAFSEDPLWNGLFGKEKHKIVILETLFKTLLQYLYKKGIIVSTSSEIEGLMVWTKGGRKNGRLDGIHSLQAAFGFLKLVKYMPIKRLMNLISVLYKFETMKEERMKGVCHCYLEVLFVQKQFRGKKYGSRLLNTLIAYCDNKNLLCFLDTNNPVNLSIYERYGFVVKDACKMGNDNINDYFMERKPIALAE